jgi:hypothetical protein
MEKSSDKKTSKKKVYIVDPLHSDKFINSPFGGFDLSLKISQSDLKKLFDFGFTKYIKINE